VRERSATLPRLEDGWLLVACDASVLVPVWIKVGRDEFKPAYRDFHEGRRVAKIRSSGVSRKTTVTLRVGETSSAAGSIGS